MLIGAAGNSLPDIDFVAALWNDPASNLLAHRGFTHSLLFGMIATVLLALIAEHFHKAHKVGWKLWLWFFAIQLALHLSIDSLNAYGMGLLEPFSHHRFAGNIIYVADPFFSVWLAVSFAALLLIRKMHRRKVVASAALSVSACYLLYCFYNKTVIDQKVELSLKRAKIEYVDYFTTPTPLNNWLWFVVARQDTGFYISHISVFDRKPTDFAYFPKNESLLRNFNTDEDVLHLLRFSQGYYTVERRDDTTLFNVLKFGQSGGWQNARAAFVFQYQLGRKADNSLVLQRGRFSGWGRSTFVSLVERIRGN